MKFLGLIKYFDIRRRVLFFSEVHIQTCTYMCRPDNVYLTVSDPELWQMGGVICGIFMFFCASSDIRYFIVHSVAHE